MLASFSSSSPPSSPPPSSPSLSLSSTQINSLCTDFTLITSRKNIKIRSQRTRIHDTVVERTIEGTTEKNVLTHSHVLNKCNLRSIR